MGKRNSTTTLKRRCNTKLSNEWPYLERLISRVSLSSSFLSYGYKETAILLVIFLSVF